MKNSKSLLKTAAAAVGVLHCINKVIESSTTGNDNAKTSGKYYHWKHGDIFYKVSGSGKPLLLIHDLSVFSSNYEWSKLARVLSDSYTVYTLDLIGCGKSDKPALTYTNYFYVQMISDFVTNVIGSKTNVAVTGLSASFVLMANALNKELFDEIMLVNPRSISSLKIAPDDRSKIVLKLFELPVIGKTLYYIATNKANADYYLTEKCFHNPFDLTPAVTKAYYDAAHTSKGSGKSLLASLGGNYLNADITRAIKNAENRIVLVLGMHVDNRSELMKSYTAINPNIAVELISNAGHLPQLESSEEMLEVMYHF